MINDFLDILGVFRGSPFNCRLDTVLRHVNAFGILNRRAKPRIPFGIGSAEFYCNGNFLPEFGERLGHFVPAFHLAHFAKFECSSHTSFCKKGLTIIFCLQFLQAICSSIF